MIVTAVLILLKSYILVAAGAVVSVVVFGDVVCVAVGGCGVLDDVIEVAPVVAVVVVVEAVVVVFVLVAVVVVESVAIVLVVGGFG